MDGERGTENNEEMMNFRRRKPESLRPALYEIPVQYAEEVARLYKERLAETQFAEEAYWKKRKPLDEQRELLGEEEFLRQLRVIHAERDHACRPAEERYESALGKLNAEWKSRFVLAPWLEYEEEM